MKSRMAIFLAVALVLSCCACSRHEGEDSNDSSSGSRTSSTADPTASSVDMELNSTVIAGTVTDVSDYACIELNGRSASADTNAVQIRDGCVTITDGGTYLISGTLEEGMLMVDADKTDKVELILNGVGITSSTSAAIYVRQADRCTLILAEGSSNYLANGGSYVAIDDHSIDAVIFSRDDLFLKGSGALSIWAKAGHGVVSKDDLKVKSGSYTVLAASHGLCGKDSVQIEDGTFALTTGKDGIQADHDEDATCGNVLIQGGVFKILSTGDGISASGTLQIDRGSFDLTCGGGSQKASSNTDVSSKGIKATGALSISDGVIVINSADDGIHSDASVTVQGGDLTIATGDDGIHADETTTICGGTIRVTESYEGIEGQIVEISGGFLEIVSEDDGINAAGGQDGSGMGGFRGDDSFRGGFGGRPGGGMPGEMGGGSSSASILISGGIIRVNAAGDGLDSNGSLTVSGGEVYICGPTDNGNGALDYDGTAVISGGIVIAVGSSGMAQNFGSTSTQGSLLINTGNQSGGLVQITDENGTVLASFTAEKSFSTAVISCPGLQVGSSYQISAGNYRKTLQLTSLIYSEAGMGGGMGGGGMRPR